MNLLVFVLLVFVIAVNADEKYTTKYDNVDYEEILKSDRLLKNYINCLLDKGNCTPDGAELKRNLPDALQTECAKCSDVQKTATKKVIEHLIKNKREWWNELEAVYDPNGNYKRKYEDKLKSEGLSLE